MCWTYFETVGHSLKNLGPSQKTLRSPYCPKLVTCLVASAREWNFTAQMICWYNAIEHPRGNTEWQYWQLLCRCITCQARRLNTIVKCGKMPTIVIVTQWRPTAN